ncbi:MAG: PAS domain S-box protein [Gammaproteobacteria bacterium]|nr:PAS domain S-box protein [Gammaproteobacteria bacterium]
MAIALNRNKNSVLGLFLLVILIPLFLVSFGFWQYHQKYESDIEFLQRERLGLREIQRLYGMMLMLQKIRGLDNLYSLAGNGRLLPTIVEHSDRLRAAIRAGVQAPQISALGLDGELAEWGKNVSSLLVEAGQSRSNTPAFDRYSQLVGEMQRLIVQAADRSNLTLDGQLESFYLVNAAVHRIPVMTEQLASIRGLVSPLVGQTPPVSVVRAIEAHRAILQNETHRLTRMLQQHLRDTPGQYLRVLENLSQLAGGLDDFLKQVALVQQGGVVPGTPTYFFNEISKFVDDIQQLHQQVVDDADTVLSDRIVQLRRQQWEGELGFGLALLTMLGSAAIFYRNNRRVMRQLSQSEDELLYFKRSLDRAQDGVFMFAPASLELLYANARAMQQLGYQNDDVLQMRAFELMVEFSEAQLREKISPLLSGQQQSMSFETHYRQRDGHLIPAEVVMQYFALHNDEGRFVAIMRDIGERNRAEA